MDKSLRGKLSTHPLVTLSDPNISPVLEGKGSGEDPKTFQQGNGKASEMIPTGDQGSMQGTQGGTKSGGKIKSLIRSARGDVSGVEKEKEGFSLPLKRAPEDFAKGISEFKRYKEMRYDHDHPYSVSTSVEAVEQPRRQQ